MAQITLNSSGVASSGTLALQSNGTTTAVTVDASQNVGVGTASPAVRLNVTDSSDGSTSGTIRLGSDGTYYAQNQFRYNSSEYRIGVYGAGQFMSLYTAGSERMRLDSSGNLGIGTTPQTGVRLDIRSNVSNATLTDMRNTNATGYGIYIAAAGSASQYVQRWADYNNNPLATLDGGGNLLVGTTTAGDGKVRISTNANAFNILKLDDTGSTGGNYVQFLNSAGSNAGTINHSGTTSVSYNSGSDYRLKNITGPVTNAIGFINSLKPKVGTWKEDGSKFVGFLAHEFAEVCPQAVQGEKDGVDADGKPLYQSMEASSPEVIANIVSLLQEQQALITQLQADVAALKA